MVDIRTPEIDAPLPPQSIEAEKHVLGGLLIASWAFESVDFLRPEYFYFSQHRKIYSCIVSLIDRNLTVDAMTVQDAMPGEDYAYISGLALNTPSAANIRRYAEIVKQRWMLREVQRVATQAASDAYGIGADARTIAEAAEAAFLTVLDDSKGGDDIGFDEAVKRAVEVSEAPAEAVISTGLANVDRLLASGGMKPGQLVVIAGRPSMGKSALAGNIAEHTGRDKTVAVFTMEMQAHELAERSIKYHAGLLGRDDAAMHCMKLKLRVDDSPAVTLSHVRIRSRRIQRRHGLSLIVVDYLQLMESKADNREQEIAKLSRGLKALAMELRVPVIAVAQINRGVEQRQEKRPLLSDLRESGSVEQDADVVIMLYRDDYYRDDSPAKGLAEAIIRKQRGGPTGTAYLWFQPEVTRFHDYNGPVPRDPVPSKKVANFDDYKSKAAGE